MRKNIRCAAVLLVGSCVTFGLTPAGARAQVPLPPPTDPAAAPPPVSPAGPPGNGAPTVRKDPSAARPPADAAPGGLKIEGSNATLRIGFLVQPAAEYQNQTASSNEAAQYFFLRRARLMLGITLGLSFELFAETDSPNLGKPSLPGQMLSSTVGTNIQDAFVTWKPFEELKVDAGMTLIPFSHNSVQGATTLYGWDYYAYSFQQNAGLGNYVWRTPACRCAGCCGSTSNTGPACTRASGSFPRRPWRCRRPTPRRARCPGWPPACSTTSSTRRTRFSTRAPTAAPSGCSRSGRASTSRTNTPPTRWTASSTGRSAATS